MYDEITSFLNQENNKRCFREGGIEVNALWADELFKAIKEHKELSIDLVLEISEKAHQLELNKIYQDHEAAMTEILKKVA